MHQLHEVDRAAEQRMETMLPQMAQNARLTEAMKNNDPLRWAGMMNTITDNGLRKLPLAGKMLPRGVSAARSASDSAFKGQLTMPPLTAVRS